MSSRTLKMLVMAKREHDRNNSLIEGGKDETPHGIGSKNSSDDIDRNTAADVLSKNDIIIEDFRSYDTYYCFETDNIKNDELSLLMFSQEETSLISQEKKQIESISQECSTTSTENEPLYFTQLELPSTSQTFQVQRTSRFSLVNAMYDSESELDDFDNEQKENRSSNRDNCESENEYIIRSSAFLEEIPIFSHTEEVNNSIFVDEASTQKKQLGRKRLRNQTKWRRQQAKVKRLKGVQYKSAVSNKWIPAKILKTRCDQRCPRDCNIITNQQRQAIHDRFWKTESWDLRRQLIVSLIDVIDIERSRPRDNSKPLMKKNTRQYFLAVGENQNRLRVCKTMFLNTFSVSDKLVTLALAKKLKSTGSVLPPDGRGRHSPANKLDDNAITTIISHIESFPSYECHYSRERSSRKYLGTHLNISTMYKLYTELYPQNHEKEWIYRKIFNENFNLSFHPPANDTCDVCDHYTVMIKNSTEINKIKLEEEKEKHLREAKVRYNLKKSDKLRGKSSSSEVVLMIDMEKCLPCPFLSNSQSFYLRKLWVLNETILDSTNNKAYCCMWNETVGARGANEVASCLLKWICSDMGDNVEELTIWSDNCAGQNRNITLAISYIWLVLQKIKNLKIINHKFLLRGHTHMEVDSVHSVIERAKKKTTQFQIFLPHDWEQFIRYCKTNNQYVVHSMNLNNFKNLGSLYHGSHSPFVSRKKNENNEDFLISTVCWLRADVNVPGILLYKNDFQEADFKRLDVRRKRRGILNTPEVLPQVNTNPIPLSTPKFGDLQKMLQWVPEPLHFFYKNLSHKASMPEYPLSDDEDVENSNN